MNDNEQNKDVLNQLSHKKRSENDLAQILGNMCDETPNYTFLLGAGCSVTSGINNGQYLVKQWKKDIYELAKKQDEKEDDFWKRQYSWFDERNPYSSLFEKKFDLPRQRRIFVEKQIEGKTPSMGYAYLVKLIENKYINTIFTTNFDDLLNESFYRYSKIRPIVCAHDSSISSITITSKRPKIIKLHGDYLFDDIKSTLRETESLNDNMKDKFIEFSKDHGLIVVGYAGNDRSIMDILNMLLHKEDYLKYGIYWCLRKGDSISEELRKLLWKDKVFFVEIDGFDELMAFLNKKLNNGMLPIDDELLSSKRQKKLIQDMINNEYFDNTTKKNQIISQDIKELEKIVTKHIVNDVMDFLSKSEPQNSENPHKKLLGEISDDEKKIISQIRQLINSEDYVTAEEVIKNHNVSLSDPSLYNYHLLQAKIEIEKRRKTGKNNILLEQLFNALIKNRPDIQENYEEAFYLFENKRGLDYIDKAIERFPNDYHLYNIKTKEIQRLINKYSLVPNDDDIEKMTECIDNSLKLNDSPMNRAWFYKCLLYELKYKNQVDKKKQYIGELFNKISKYKTLPVVYILVSFYKELKIKESECISMIEGILEFAKTSDDWKLYERSIISLLEMHKNNGNKDKIEILMEQYEEIFKPSEYYMINKVSLLIFLKKYKDAQHLMLKHKDKSIRWKNMLFEYYCKIRLEDKAKEMLDEYFKYDIYQQLYFYHSFSHYSDFLSLLEKYEKEESLNLTLFTAKCCALIKEGKASDAFIMCKEIVEKNTIREGSIYINYYLSGKLSGNLSNVEKKVNEKIISQKDTWDREVLVAAYAIVGNKNEMYRCLQEVVEKDEIRKLSIIDWPVFDSYRKDKKFQEILSTSNIDV